MLKIENSENNRIIIGYIGFVLLSSWVFVFLIFSRPAFGLSMFTLVMFFPAIVAILFGLLQKKSIKSMFGCVVSKPNLKSMVFAVGYPLIFIAVCSIFALITGLGHYVPGNFTFIYIAVSSTLLILVNLIPVFGEEYGWRGYLLPKLTHTVGKTSATIILGLVWALYHFPVVYFLAQTTGIDNPLLIATIQAVTAFFFAFAFSYCYYLSKGSLIPVLFLHSIWNVVNVLVLGDIYTNKSGLIAGNILFINGEGVLGLIIGGILVLWFTKQFNKSNKYSNTF